MEIRQQGRLMATVRPLAVGWTVTWAVEPPALWRPRVYASRAEAVKAALGQVPWGTVHTLARGRLA